MFVMNMKELTGGSHSIGFENYLEEIVEGVQCETKWWFFGLQICIVCELNFNIFVFSKTLNVNETLSCVWVLLVLAYS